MNHGTTGAGSVLSEHFCQQMLNRYHPINICLIVVLPHVHSTENAIFVLVKNLARFARVIRETPRC